MHAIPSVPLPARLAAVLAAVNSLALAYAGPPVYYVDDDAPPGGDGLSWQTAFRDLQDALTAAGGGFRYPAPEIHLAQGTYAPDRGSLDRTASFALASAVTLIGGFAGLGAPDPDLRDPARFVSILSGDLRRDDAPNFGNREDNSYHVVDITHSDISAQLIGLTIRAGHANGDHAMEADRGAAIFGARDMHCAIEFFHCAVVDNFATNDAAAISINSGWAYLVDSLFADNRTAGLGHASCVYVPEYIEAHRCRFTSNGTDSGSAAASALASGGYLVASDCLFDSNGPANPALYAEGQVQIRRCTFAGNSIGETGVLHVAVATFAEIGGCIFDNAGAGGSGVEIFVSGADDLYIYNSDVVGGRDAVDGSGGIHWDASNLNANPLFVAPDGPDHDPATWQDNDFSLSPASPCIDAGIITVYPNDDQDLLGNPRYFAARGDCLQRSDIGAIEFQHPLAPAPPVRIYVRADAAPGGDGHSWSSPFRDLNDALRTPGVREIWLAAGTYTPDAGTRDRMASFFIQCGVRILGGFAGSESDPAERDSAANPTILSGDLLHNDDATPQSRADNSYHVLRLQVSDALIDAVTIERGQGPDPFNAGGGAGIDAYRARVTLRNCTLRDCINTNQYASGAAINASSTDLTLEQCLIIRNSSIGTDYAAGGAIHLYDGSLTALHCDFIDNLAQAPRFAWGGAIDHHGTHAVLIGCSFARNRAISSDADGHGDASYGALRLSARDPFLANCTFTDNHALGGETHGSADSGAGLLSGMGATVVGCVFSANTARASAAFAGALTIESDQPLVANSTITGNAAITTTGAAFGGGLSIYSMGARIENCILWNNTDSSGTSLLAQLRAEPGTATVSHSCIHAWSNAAGFPGPANFSADPLFVSESDLRLSSTSPCLNTGDATLLPSDAADLDHDADTTEPLPLDAARRPRLVGPALDIGAFESQPTPCRADYNADASLDSADFFAFLTDFFTNAPHADFNTDGVISAPDLFDYLTAFFAGC